jgi:transaldolase
MLRQALSMSGEWRAGITDRLARHDRRMATNKKGLTPLESIINTGTKLWLDGVEPGAIRKSRALGITGATSNPTIVSKIIADGRSDRRITELIQRGLDDDVIAWTLDDELVKSTQEVFLPVWEETAGDDGYVSFELDPLIEDRANPLSHDERVRQYVELGKRWSKGHRNRMIKVPATAAGLDALEELAAAGVMINVTLMFTERQYSRARDAIWRGARRRADGLRGFKSVYSIFVSRIDAYVEKHLHELSPAAKGQAGIATARRVWRLNREFWKDKNVRLQQEIVFASTGVKNPAEPPDKYVEALAGSDIQTNPPATNEAVQRLNKQYTREVDHVLPDAVLNEIEEKVDMSELERVLLEEGTEKFAKPQKDLLRRIADKRASIRDGAEDDTNSRSASTAQAR